MPQFRLQQDEIEAIAAFIWQSGDDGPALDKQAPGDPAKGKIALESRGCLACHSIGEGSQLMGGDFAANLSRVGEKENYDYLVRWIHDPRQRTRPYDPFEKRDLGPDDYAKKGLPFVFDVDHSRSPINGHELVVEQPTIMPSLRLSWDESRDIASYLMTQKHDDANYAPAPAAMKFPASKKKAASVPSSPTKAASPSNAWISRSSPKTPKKARCPMASNRPAARGTTSKVSSSKSSPIPPSSIAANTNPIRWIACACRSRISRPTMSTN
jgi:hypothetical protein